MQGMFAPATSDCELTTAHRELLRRPAALLLLTYHKNAFLPSLCLLLPPVFARIPLPTWMKHLWRSCDETVGVRPEMAR
jgi:hypothetical protein